MKRAVTLSFFLPWLVCSGAAAGEPILAGETVHIQSSILGEERRILVLLPPGYEGGRERYPVLYVTDGDAHAIHTRGTAHFLARNGLIPAVIVVGIPNTDRARDLTPTRGGLPREGGSLRPYPNSGGGERFLQFFERELLPYVDSHYRTQPCRLLAGHSLGGLSALYAFFTRPGLFAGVIAASPALEWDDALPLRQAESFFEGRESANATLVVTMANEEAGLPRPTPLDRLETTLEKARAEGFEWLVVRLPNESHGSSVLLAYYWGLRKIFEPWPLPANPATGAFSGDADDLREHFAGLSQRYGFSVVPSEQTVNLIGYQILGEGDVERAIGVFRYNAALYPDAPNVHDSLGEALERAGRLTEAFSSYSRAVDRATEARSPLLETFIAHRDRVKAQL